MIRCEDLENVYSVFIQIYAHCFPAHIFLIMVLEVKKRKDQKRENDNLSPLAL